LGLDMAEWQLSQIEQAFRNKRSLRTRVYQSASPVVRSQVAYVNNGRA